MSQDNSIRWNYYRIVTAGVLATENMTLYHCKAQNCFRLLISGNDATLVSHTASSVSLTYLLMSTAGPCVYDGHQTHKPWTGKPNVCIPYIGYLSLSILHLTETQQWTRIFDISKDKLDLFESAGLFCHKRTQCLSHSIQTTRRNSFNWVLILGVSTCHNHWEHRVHNGWENTLRRGGYCSTAWLVLHHFFEKLLVSGSDFGIHFFLVLHKVVLLAEPTETASPSTVIDVITQL